MSNKTPRLDWPELIKGKLVKRYKRFLADIELSDGNIITAHCANSGKMTECCTSGQPVWLSYHDNPKRKLKYTWELIQMATSLVGVNTQVPNRLVSMSVESGAVKELAGYENIKREVKTGDNSRLDILLTKENSEQCFIEVKNCTLVKDRIAQFPDAVTKRGHKHLVEMQKLTASGIRCVMFYLIQRTDADVFKPADSIDPEYGKELRKAVKNGVEILAYDTGIDLKGIWLNRRISCELDSDTKLLTKTQSEKK
ncbi:DNA/RNA nuclease SfsA [Desulfobacterales bacterium HSG17]|nr:DNA/RNA nuclease SfsA [Desulfobacterales bacterium HSG17]